MTDKSELLAISLSRVTLTDLLQLKPTTKENHAKQPKLAWSRLLG